MRTTHTGTRKALGIEFGDNVTLETYQGPVTGTVVPDRNGWKLANHDAPNGHLPGFGHATRVTVTHHTASKEQ